MSKIVTADIEAYQKKHKKKKKEGVSLARDAWRRLCRNKTAVIGLVIMIALIIIAIFAPLIAPYPYDKQDYSAVSQAPSMKHLFGTDNLGRDIFSRCIWGTRWSLPLGLICVVTGLALGGTLGVIAGFAGGKVDNVIMRIMDVFQAIPAILMAIAVVAVLGNGVPQLVVAMSIAFMPNTAKVCRAAIFTVKDNDYVESSISMGVSVPKIIVRHLIPNSIGVIIINAVGMVGAAILMVSGLSYIGVGIVPPLPEWGALLSAGKAYMGNAIWMVFFPGMMISLAVISSNLLGDGLRDALDPRLK